jgi:hypothetical protein
MSSIFGWSYPPGCSSAPYDEESAFDLADGDTIKGYGRVQHGLNGKDADLDYGGQNRVSEAWWMEGGTISISGHRYASICPGEHWDDQLMDAATELVIDCGYPGEWDGDYWVIGEDYSLSLTLDWDDEKTEEENLKAARAAAVSAISEDSAAFESAMTALAKSMDTLPSERRVWRKLHSAAKGE